MEDIYDNLDNYDEEYCNETNEKLRTENSNLKEKLDSITLLLTRLQADHEELEKKYRIMERNFSSLLKTAKSEIQRKTQLMTALNAEKDQLIIKSLSDSSNNCYRKDTTFTRSVTSSDDSNKSELLDNRKGKIGSETAPGSDGRSKSKLRTTIIVSEEETNWQKEEMINVPNERFISIVDDIDKDTLAEQRAVKGDCKENVNSSKDESNYMKSNFDKNEKVTSMAENIINKMEFRSEISFSKQNGSPKYSSDDGCCTDSTHSFTMKHDGKQSNTSEQLNCLSHRENSSASMHLDSKRSKSHKSSRSSYNDNRSDMRYKDSDTHRYRDKNESSYNRKRMTPTKQSTSRRHDKSPHRDYREQRYHRNELDRRKIVESPPSNSHYRRSRDHRSRDRFTDHRNELGRRKILESPPSKSHYRRSRDRRSRDQSTGYHHNDGLELKATKHKLEIDYEESLSSKKRQKIHENFEGHGMGINEDYVDSGKYEDKDAVKHLMEDVGSHAPDNVTTLPPTNAELTGVVKEIENEHLQLKDPRLGSKKYVKIFDDKNNFRIATISGRGVDLKRIYYDTSNIYSDYDPSLIPKSCISLSVDYLNDVYGDSDNSETVYGISVKSTEVNHNFVDQDIKWGKKLHVPLRNQELQQPQSSKQLTNKYPLTTESIADIPKLTDSENTIKVFDNILKEIKSAIPESDVNIGDNANDKTQSGADNYMLITAEEIITNNKLCDGQPKKEMEINRTQNNTVNTVVQSNFTVRETVEDDLELSDETIDYEVSNNSCMINDNNSVKENFPNLKCQTNSKISIESNKCLSNPDSNIQDVTTKLKFMLNEESLITPEDLGLPSETKSIQVLGTLDDSFNTHDSDKLVEHKHKVEKKSKKSSNKKHSSEKELVEDKNDKIKKQSSTKKKKDKHEKKSKTKEDNRQAPVLKRDVINSETTEDNRQTQLNRDVHKSKTTEDKRRAPVLKTNTIKSKTTEDNAEALLNKDVNKSETKEDRQPPLNSDVNKSKTKEDRQPPLNSDVNKTEEDRQPPLNSDVNKSETKEDRQPPLNSDVNKSETKEDRQPPLNSDVNKSETKEDRQPPLNSDVNKTEEDRQPPLNSNVNKSETEEDRQPPLNSNVNKSETTEDNRQEALKKDVIKSMEDNRQALVFNKDEGQKDVVAHKLIDNKLYEDKNLLDPSVGTKNFNELHAIATSTPIKPLLFSERKFPEYSIVQKISTIVEDSTSDNGTDDCNKNKHVACSENTTKPANIENNPPPDMRIVVKRRRTILKKSTPIPR